MVEVTTPPPGAAGLPAAPTGTNSPAPLFSIITVCLNSEATIRKTAASLLSQSCQDWEWLVIDGASRDATCAIIRELAPAEPRLRLTSERDSGIFDAMNKGVSMVRGQYVYFLNADDRFADDRVLDDVAVALRSEPGTDLLYGNIFVEAPDQSCIPHKPPGPEGALEEMVCGCLPHQASFARRALFAPDRIGPFDLSLRYSADYQWLMSLVSDPACRLHYVDRTIAFFFNAGNSSDLTGCLPESFRVLNQHTAFQEAIGQPRLLQAYQSQVFALRVEVGKLRAECVRERAQKSSMKSKLTEAVRRRDEYKEKLQALKFLRGGKRPKRVHFPWLPAWMRF